VAAVVGQDTFAETTELVAETTVVVEQEDALAVAVEFRVLLFFDTQTLLMRLLQQLVLHRFH